jgi:hypothetical protein
VAGGAGMSGYSDWLQRQPTDDTWEAWRDEGRRQGYLDGDPPPQPSPTNGADHADVPPPHVDMPCPTWRTLADVSDAPPGPLIHGMMEPNGPTLAYGAPGVGKGSTGAYVVCESQRTGMKPAIFDAERRPREWARRVSGLGGDRSRVVYLEPEDLPTNLRGRPLWDVAPAIGQVCRRAGLIS